MTDKKTFEQKVAESIVNLLDQGKLEFIENKNGYEFKSVETGEIVADVTRGCSRLKVFDPVNKETVVILDAKGVFVLSTGILRAQYKILEASRPKLKSTPSLERLFLFLLSFLSGRSEIPPATAVFFFTK